MLSSLSMGKDMKVAKENVPAKRISTQRSIQKITYLKVGVSKGSLASQQMKLVYLGQCHYRLLPGELLLIS